MLTTDKQVGSVHQMSNLSWKMSPIQSRPRMGKIVGHMRMRKNKKEDREEINEHYISEGDKSPKDPDTATSCPTNKEHNAVEYLAWEKDLAANHPKVNSNELPPDNALYIKCSMRKNKKKVLRVVHNISHSRLRDNSIRVTAMFPTKEQRFLPFYDDILYHTTW